MRVVSLLPSTTEIVVALGHGGDLVGRSHECDYPPGVEDLPVVSRPRREPVGTSAEIHRGVLDLLEDVLSIYQVDARALAAAAPDLVLTQDLCRVCAVSQAEVARAARKVLDRELEIVTCSPLALAEVLNDVERIAAALGDRPAGVRLRRELQAGFDRVRATAPPTDRPRVAVLEWVDPLMGCGNWAPELVQIAGGEPVLATPGGHTPFADPAALATADPDVIIVGPCGYTLERSLDEIPVLERVPGWRDLRAVRAGRVAFIDGSAYLNRPGPRLLDTAQIFANILAGDEPGSGWTWSPSCPNHRHGEPTQQQPRQRPAQPTAHPLD